MSHRINLKFLISYVRLLWIFVIAPASVYGQYQEGESLNENTLNRIVFNCANGTGSTTLGSFFIPDAGENTRVVWLSFFASW